MCCLINGEPIEDPDGRLKTFNSSNRFQKSMLGAPLADSYKSCGWFCGQFFPCTCGITQYLLRKKVLHDDMTKYSCFQGYFEICCIKAGTCKEESCPELCLCCEGCICNFAAVSASRVYVMEKYNLSSDPCDYRLIRINNCLQALACICTLLSLVISELRHLAKILSLIADIFYHCVSGCMTAQVAFEQNYQDNLTNPTLQTPLVK